MIVKKDIFITNMTCEHIKRVQDKINDLIKSAGNSDSYLYEKKGPYVELEEVKKYLKQFNSPQPIHMERLILTLSLGAVEKFHTITPNYDVLYDNLSDLFNELNNCDCRVKARKEGINEAKETIISIENKNNELVEKYNELVVASKGISKSHDYLEEKSRNDDNQIGRLELRLDQRRVEVRTLENQLTALRLESGG